MEDADMSKSEVDEIEHLDEHGRLVVLVCGEGLALITSSRRSPSRCPVAAVQPEEHVGGRGEGHLGEDRGGGEDGVGVADRRDAGLAGGEPRGRCRGVLGQAEGGGAGGLPHHEEGLPG